MLHSIKPKKLNLKKKTCVTVDLTAQLSNTQTTSKLQFDSFNFHPVCMYVTSVSTMIVSLVLVAGIYNFPHKAWD